MPNMLYDINKAEINARRSIFRIPHNNKTTLNAGDLIPAMQPIEVLPGDTFKCDLSAVCRELTLLSPVMDSSYLQIDVFFTPKRLVWENTKQFFGENETGIWTQTIEREIPHGNFDLEYDASGLTIGSLGDYFCLPIIEAGDEGSETVDYLPLRAYAMIYNYWYLNEATQAPIQFSKGDNVTFGSELEAGYNSMPLKVNRYSDLFTSATPSPQKGPEVSFLPQFLPVHTTNDSDLINTIRGYAAGDNSELSWMKVNGDPISNAPVSLMLGEASGAPGDGTFVDLTPAGGPSGTRLPVSPKNLVANTALTQLHTINEFRIAAATQQYYENLARFGSRYSEGIYALFAVKTKDATIQVPQYLGGYKHVLNVDQVLATAQGSEYTVGSTGAFSNTGFFNKPLFTFSSDEYGYIIVLAHIRTDNTYSQGIPKIFSKKNKFDIYNPLFANIGNVPIKNKEIYFSDLKVKDDEVFGYQEAWYEYKFIPNSLTGYMRPGVSGGLSNWTYGRVFTDTPVLNSEFTEQTADEVDRTIAVSTENTHQFKLDLFFNFTLTRVMPLQSVPGLKRI